MAPKDGGLLFWIGGVLVIDAEKATLMRTFRTERMRGTSSLSLHERLKLRLEQSSSEVRCVRVRVGRR